MGKPLLSKPTPGVYRAPSDRNDASSTSSAVLMDDIDYFDAEPPAYEDVATTSRPTPARSQEPQSYLIHPTLPASQVSGDETTTTTHWPLYTQDASFLTEMLKEQAKYPPIYTARIVGTHIETKREKDKTEEVTITDFDVRLDMTHLLVPSPDASHSLMCRGFDVPLPQVKAFRGHRTKTDCLSESTPDAEAYIHSYISSSFPVRSFTLNRRILHHNTAALEALITSLVRSTNYRGHLNVTFPITHSRVTVYSPCWQNDYRERLWLRWIFYLTFLWVISWPYLWFVTRRWEVVTAVFPYSTAPERGNRQYATKSEESYFKDWRTSIRRAVLGKMQGWIDEEYKLATEEATSQAGSDGSGTMPGTSNAIANGDLGFLRQAVTVGRDIAMAGGWGADS